MTGNTHPDIEYFIKIQFKRCNMANRKDRYFAIFSILFLLCLAYTGWQNTIAAPQACGGNLIDSPGCGAYVSNTIFFTIMELFVYLVVSVLLRFWNKS